MLYRVEELSKGKYKHIVASTVDDSMHQYEIVLPTKQKLDSIVYPTTCHNCGTEVSNKAKTCSKCGKQEDMKDVASRYRQLNKVLVKGLDFVKQVDDLHYSVTPKEDVWLHELSTPENSFKVLLPIDEKINLYHTTSACKICHKVDGKSTVRGYCVKCAEERDGYKISIDIKKIRAFIKYGVTNNQQTKETKNKRKLANRKKYGVDHIFQTKDMKEKSKETCMSKYGVEYISQSDLMKEKSKETCMSKYGVEYISQSDLMKDKSKETCMAKYGVDNYFQTDEFKVIRRDVLLEKYGVESPMQTDEIKEQKRLTSQERYGVDYYSQTDEYNEKVKSTSQAKYGVDYYSQTEESKEKIKETCLKKYGVESYSYTDEFKEKFNETCMAKYGVESPMQTDEIKEQKRLTSQERYGVDNYSQTDEFLEALKETCQERYGVDYYTQTDESKEKIKETCLKKYGVESYYQSDEFKEKRKQALLEWYGVEHPFLSGDILESRRNNNSIRDFGKPFEEIRKEWRKVYLEEGEVAVIQAFPKISIAYARNNFLEEGELLFKASGTSSVPEKFLKGYLERETSMSFHSGVRSIVPGNNHLEIDMVNFDNKTSIEFDGIYWHQYRGEGTLDKDLAKAEAMRSIGYTHISINEVDLQNIELLHKISRMIEPKKKTMYARKLKVKMLPTESCRNFLNENHIQGSRGAKYTFCLLDEMDEIIQLMSFGVSRYDKNVDFEMIRLATKNDCKVVGGTQRLWKAFLKEVNPESVVSYSDNKYFSGEIYGKLGFEYEGNTASNYIWWKQTTGKILKRYQTMKHKLPALLGENFDEDLSESINMQNNGFIKVKDLGNKKWVWLK